MELATNEKTTNAKTLLRKRWEWNIFPEKKRGVKTKRFFTHCSTRNNFK